MKIKNLSLRNIIKEEIGNFLNKDIITVYKCIDKEFDLKQNEIEFFAVDKDYAKKFDDNCYEIKLNIGNAKILNLQKWNELYTSKTGKNGNRFNRQQGLFIIGEMAISSNYEDELKIFKEALGEELTKKFLNEFYTSDAIYGEDAGYVGAYVFAVKNKDMIIDIKLLDV